MYERNRIFSLCRWCVVLVPVLLLLLAIQPAGAGSVITNPTDTRAYQTLTLGNRLQVLLVSDPRTDKAAAALDVAVGYYSDPPARPGLAHFLEHMLFLGTGKYPQPDSYQEFIGAHGGEYNAYTDSDHTVYFFDIDQEFLPEALDRFSQFFVAPLFDAKYVEREKQAVDSEYRMKISDDWRRFNQVQKETSNPRHPFSKFAVGSLDTLGDREHDPVRADLIAFYEEHYSANLMTLVVIGSEPLPELRRMVEGRFGQIKDRDRSVPPITEPLVTADQKQVRIDLVPVKEQRELHLEFVIPWSDADYLRKPTQTISHLLGHEGEGSLYARLKAAGWVNELWAGSQAVDESEAILGLSINLTEAGLDHVDDIAAKTFQYIRLIGEQGISPRVYDELARVNGLDFRFREPGTPRTEAVSLARNLHHYPPELVLEGPYHLEPYDEQGIRKVLGYLTPGNLRMTVMAPKLPTDREARWYGTPYQFRKIPEQTVKAWQRAAPDPALAIPGPNLFLPEKAELAALDGASNRPLLILDEAGLKVWHMQDADFRVPKADIYINIDTARAADSPLDQAMSVLYAGLATDALNAYAYPAEVAGLYYSIHPRDRGLGLTISGYDEKQRLLIDTIVDKLLKLQVDPARFAQRKEHYIQQWKNVRLNVPYKQTSRELGSLLYASRNEPDALVQSAEQIGPEELQRFIPQLLSQVRVELLVHGNVTRAAAAELGRDIAARLTPKAEPGAAVTERITRLAPGTDYLRTLEVKHQDSALLVYFQAPDDTIATTAQVLLLEQAVRGPFFHELRTKEQLGYLVYADSVAALRVPGLQFVIQSPVVGPRQLLQRIDDFLGNFSARLAKLDGDAFAQLKDGVLTRLNQRDNTLQERSERYRDDLALKYYDFDYRARLADAVKGIDQEGLVKFYRNFLLSAKRSRLIIQAAGERYRDQLLQADAEGADGSGIKPITDVDAFKRSLPYFEL